MDHSGEGFVIRQHVLRPIQTTVLVVRNVIYAEATGTVISLNLSVRQAYISLYLDRYILLICRLIVEAGTIGNAIYTEAIRSIVV